MNGKIYLRDYFARLNLRLGHEFGKLQTVNAIQTNELSIDSFVQNLSSKAPCVNNSYIAENSILVRRK